MPINLTKIDIKKKYLTFSGIGNPESFKTTLQTHKVNVLKNLEYPDHYQYSQKDFSKVR